jgi:hypothetical protein
MQLTVRTSPISRMGTSVAGRPYGEPPPRQIGGGPVVVGDKMHELPVEPLDVPAQRVAQRNGTSGNRIEHWLHVSR